MAKRDKGKGGGGKKVGGITNSRPNNNKEKSGLQGINRNSLTDKKGKWKERGWTGSKRRNEEAQFSFRSAGKWSWLFLLGRETNNQKKF